MRSLQPRFAAKKPFIGILYITIYTIVYTMYNNICYFALLYINIYSPYPLFPTQYSFFYFKVIVDNLKEGENYKITVATMVDGYTTDKHATQVETFADTTQTLLFPLDEGVTIEEAQDEVFLFPFLFFMQIRQP